MKRFALLLMLLAASPCQAADAIRLISDASQTLSVRVYTGSSTGVTASMTAGTGSNTQRYVVTDATLVTAGMPTARGNYDYIIYSSSLSNIIASGTMGWDTDQAIDVIRVGDPVYIDETAAAGLGDTFVERLFVTNTEDSGANTVGRAFHYLRGAFSAASVFSEEALAEAPHGTGGGGGDPIAPITISKQRTWRPSGVDASKAENIITVKAPFTGTLAVEMPLNPDADIDSVDDVDVTPPSGTVTATNLQKTADGRTVHFDVPTLTTVGTYEVVPTVTTLDGQEISMACVLIVR